MKKTQRLVYYSIAIPFLSSFISTASAVAAADNPSEKIMIIETNQGSFDVRLFADTAPKTCENFTKLAEKNYYNGVLFHRIIKGFMIQGGDPTGTGRGGESAWGGTFEDEFSDSVRFDRKGLLAMANRGPNTNSSQFFITVAPTPHLNGRHTIFGEVVSSYDVVEKISELPTDANDRPLSDVKILTVKAKA